MIAKSLISYCRSNWAAYKPMWVPEAGDICYNHLGKVGVLSNYKKKKVPIGGKKVNGFEGVEIPGGKPWYAQTPIWIPRVDQIYQALEDFGHVGMRTLHIEKPQAMLGQFKASAEVYVHSHAMDYMVWREVKTEGETLSEALLAMLIEIQESHPDTLAYEVEESKED